jgi:hypothetical protein
MFDKKKGRWHVKRGDLSKWCFEHKAILSVSELMVWVRNVVLINVYLDLEKPGGSGFGWEGI